MVTLTKALDLQSPKTETPVAPYKLLGDEARANYEQFITNLRRQVSVQCVRPFTMRPTACRPTTSKMPSILTAI